MQLTGRVTEGARRAGLPASRDDLAALLTESSPRPGLPSRSPDFP